ncbi:7522_t:CDS:2 [Gigaspora margarita]|uniref:7522_t:CDS:1 n=1 Tax=Gigaspora margarita TaxID=4874 RepID=A0ABN7VT56_GIGMA|nr:7522_t:CDS:2 [Gigaspora margarita]
MNLEKLNRVVAKTSFGKYFKLENSGASNTHNTQFTTELRTRLTTFFAMAYIVAVNASIVADSDYAVYQMVVKKDIITATAAISCLATAIIGVFANLLLGLNAYFAYIVAGFHSGDKVQYQTTIAAIFFEMAKFGGFTDETGNFEGATATYICDASSISISTIFGLPPVIAYVESGAGIIEVIVGSLIVRSIKNINWDYVGDAVSSFLTIAIIPLIFNIAYSLIADGPSNEGLLPLWLIDIISKAQKIKKPATTMETEKIEIPKEQMNNKANYEVNNEVNNKVNNEVNNEIKMKM